MEFRHIAKGTKNENWHVEWKSKDKIFRVGVFKVFTAGWEDWKFRRNYSTW